MVIVAFPPGEKYAVNYTTLDQYDYGQILRIQGLKLPKTVEVHFSTQETGGTSITRVGVTKDGVTDVLIPDSVLENGDTTQNYSIFAFVYVTDATSGKTEYRARLEVKARPKPEVPGGGDNPDIFHEAVLEVRKSAEKAEEAQRQAEGWAHGREDLPERAEDNAMYYAGKASEDAKKTAQDRAEVERLTESNTQMQGEVAKDLEEVKNLSSQAQTSATNAALSEQKSKEAATRAETAQTGAETAKGNAELAAQKTGQDKTAVEQAKKLVQQMGQEVLDNKNAVDKTVQDFNFTAQQALADVNNAGQTQTERVQSAGTTAVENIKNAQNTATQAVQTAAQEIIADREQINTNKEGVAQLKEDLEQLKQNGTGTGTGLSAEIKSALMAVVENIGLWKDGNGQTYIDNLRTALYNAPLSSISAVYTQSKTVYPTDDLDVLKEDLVVTGMYTDGSSAIVTDYTLSGSLLVGTSTITVTKDGKNTTFEVTVAETRVPATGITLNNTTLSFTGSTPIQLTATVEPLNSTDTVVWSSSENAVATVENGLVTPVSDGSCKIYATAGDITVECSVTVSLPLMGYNIGNPFLTKVDGMPSSVASTEEEAQGKWYKALFTAWTKSLNIEKTFFLHPLTNGTYYLRMVGRTMSDPIEFYAFQNADIGLNPTATLGKVGGEYTNATVTKLTSFDSEYADSMGRVDLGEWMYVDNSGTTYTSSFVYLYKVVVPENVYVFMATSEMGANRFPGISDAHPYMNDLYTIFDSDPSSNILQIVE